MNELALSPNKYSISSANDEYILESENKIVLKDVISDAEGNYILAVKNNYAKGLYSTDYIFISSAELRIVSVLTEDMGVNPRFIIAPDKTVWVSLSSTCTEKDGEIVLPFNGRERIAEPVPKKDVGMDYFIFNGQSYGYITDIFAKKEDKLVVYSFDKRDMFKSRKQIKLENIFGSAPLVVNGRCFLPASVKEDDKFSLHIYETDSAGNIGFICKTDAIGDPLTYAIDFADDIFTLVSRVDNRLELLRITSSGALIDKNVLFEDKNCDFINNMWLRSNTGRLAVNCVSSDITAITRRDERFCFRNEPIASDIKACSEHYFISNVKSEWNYIKIAPIR